MLPATTTTSAVECARCYDTGRVDSDDCYVHGTPCSCERGLAVAAEEHAARLARTAAAHAALFDRAGVPREFRGLTVEGIARLGDEGKAAAVAAVGEWLARQTDGAVSEAGQPVAFQHLHELRALSLPKPGLILLGGYGVGKTGLLSAAYQARVARGVGGLWIELYDFFEAVQAGYADGRSAERLEAAQAAPLLLIDDLGTTRRLVRSAGPPGEWASRPETDDKQAILDKLVSHRHREHLPTLATTNLTLDQLAEQFDGRIVERLIQSCETVRMGGRNLRLSPPADGSATDPA